jgi:dihydrofolate reductase
MRELIVNTFVTLDGVMQAPGGPPEDPSDGFDQGGWSVNYWDDTMNQVMGEAMSEPSEMLLGRKTYEIFAAHWPYSTEPGADELNQSKKYVVSRTLDHVDWNNSTLIKGDAVAEIRKLKAQDGPVILVHGSGNLIQTLIKNDLIDKYRLWIFPVIIGKGKRLFDFGTIPSGLKLGVLKTSGTGVIIAEYVPEGEIKLGTFELDTPSEAELARREKLARESKSL